MKLDHITLLVSSLEKSMPYYEALLPLLGFQKTSDHNWTDGEGFWFQFRQANTETHEYQRYAAGMNHLGFGVDTVAQVEQVRQAMAESGFEVPKIQHLGGATALFMKDPDGIRFEVSHYAPGTAVVD